MLFDEANGLLPVPSRCQFIRNTYFIDLYLTHIRSYVKFQIHFCR